MNQSGGISINMAFQANTNQCSNSENNPPPPFPHHCVWMGKGVKSLDWCFEARSLFPTQSVHLIGPKIMAMGNINMDLSI